MMDNIAILLAEADPATTPRDAPLPQEALDLLARIVATPTSDTADDRAPAARGRQAWFRAPRLAIGASVAAVLLIVAVFAVSQLSPFRGVQNATDYPWYGTVSQLVDASDAIVVGRVLSEREEVIDGIDYSVVTVQVDAVAQGHLRPGESVDVKYPLSESTPVGLKPGDTTILFLAVHADSPASLLNPVQASYLITDGGIDTNPDNPIRLSRDILDQLGIAG
ncbi:MAG: hypothetical protein QM602_04235 [Microbacterium sp.]